VGSIKDVKHVVILMQENRSFDQYFGTLRGVRGFFDPHAMKQSDHSTIFAQKKGTSTLYPFHKDTATTSAETSHGNSHSWTNQHGAWNDGKLDAFRLAHSPDDSPPYDTILSYFTGADIPYHTALAQTFTICDSYFCSVLGPTAPNRIYLMSGTIDAYGTRGGPATGNPGKTSSGLYHWESYPEQLAEVGVDWAIYDEQEMSGPDSPPFNLNVAAYFSGWPAALHKTPNGLRLGEGTFENDLAHFRLPTVSWIVPPYDYTEHPRFPPANGAHWISKKISALLASSYWKSTVFILIYDENDGSFDHVPPPTSPEGTEDEWVTTGNEKGCVGPGFRVPCIIVSPWTVGGKVSSRPFDHTSVLRLLEDVTGINAANVSAYRRHTLESLTKAIDFSTAISASNVPILPAAHEYVTNDLPPPVAPKHQTWPPSLDRLSAVGWPGDRAYFFRGGKYLRFMTGKTGTAVHPDHGYPKDIKGEWPKLSSVDAGFVMADGKAYLFSANQYVRLKAPPNDRDANAGKYTLDGDYPADIWVHWHQFWASDVDAAVDWTDGKTYIFKGPEYIRFSKDSHMPDLGYPRPILGHWPRLGEAFPHGIDAAVVWSSEKAYFFKGHDYVRYTISGDEAGVDNGYPRSISHFSPELASL
jgi:phospholipase C